tara:strand:+ start:432 stop:731 length:300 start_codon:yes stop_codon:yes gene_type:complete
MENVAKSKELSKKTIIEEPPDREWLADLVKIIVLIWSASLLTFSYVRLPNGQKILDFDPTFIASVFSGSLASWGLSPSKNGRPGAPQQAPEIPKKKEDR